MAKPTIKVQTLPASVSPGLAYFARLKQRRDGGSDSLAEQRGKNKGKERAVLDHDEGSSRSTRDEAGSYFPEQRSSRQLFDSLKAIEARKLGRRNDMGDGRNDQDGTPRRVLYPFGEEDRTACASHAPEELCWHGHTLVWSRGSAIHRIFTYDKENTAVAPPDGPTLQCHIIKQALFAYFEVPCTPGPSSSIRSGNDGASTPQHEGNDASMQAESPPELYSSPSASEHSSSSSLRSSILGPFHGEIPPAWSDDNRSSLLAASVAETHTAVTLTRCLVVYVDEQLFVYMPDGSSHIVHLPFALDRIWPLEKGLLVERDDRVTLEDLWDDVFTAHVQDRSGTSRARARPRIYCLADVFGELQPLAKVSTIQGVPCARVATAYSPHEITATHSGGKQSILNDPAERVVFTSSRRLGEEPIMVTCNEKMSKLSIWLIAEIRSTPEEELEQLRALCPLPSAGSDTTLLQNRGQASSRKGNTSGQMHDISGAVIGKRRRSNDSAIQRFSIAPNPSGGHAAMPADTRRQSQTMDRPRSSLMGQYANLPQGNTGSVAHFLDAMGTSVPSHPGPTDRANSQANGNRRITSFGTTLVAPGMDRRASSSRNELSVSLDRMALSSRAAAPRMSSYGRADALLQGNSMLHPSPTFLPTGISHQGTDCQTGLPIADIHEHAGNGAMERETSFVGEEHLDAAAGTMFVARLHSFGLDAMTDEDISRVQCEIFDVRGSSSILAVCLPHTNAVHLLRLTRDMLGNGSPGGSVICSPIRQTDGVSIARMLSTRPDIFDLVCLASDGSIQILSADAHALIVLPNCTMRPKTIAALAPSSVVLRFEAGQADEALHMRFWPETRLAGSLLCHLAGVLPSKAFWSIYSHFLKNSHGTPSMAKSRGHAEFSCLASAAFSPKAANDDVQHGTLESDWKFLIHVSSQPDLRKALSSDLSSADLDANHLSIILVTANLLKEECKLLIRRQQDVKTLADFVARLGAHLGQAAYVDAAIRDGADVSLAMAYLAADPDAAVLPALLDLGTALGDRLQRAVSRDPLVEYLDFCKSAAKDRPANFFGEMKVFRDLKDVLSLYDQWHSSPTLPVLGVSTQSPAERVVLHCAALGWQPDDLDGLSTAYSMPIREAIRQCQLICPALWPAQAYALLGRADQIAMSGVVSASLYKSMTAYKVRRRPNFAVHGACDIVKITIKPISHPQHSIRRKSKDKATRFSSDTRLDSVQKMLQYTSPVVLRGPQGPHITEADLPGLQQRLLLALANRTLALPVGHAAFMYRCTSRPRSQVMAVPKVELTAKLLPQTSAAMLTPDTLPPEQKTWAYFHSGVSVALQVAWGPNDFDASEFTFNRPNELNARHAGFLLGLGLTGQLRSLGTYQAFKYMDPKHEYTSVGLLLGLGAAYVATSDPKVSSALSVHVAALHPLSSAQLNVSMTIQSAALVGLGLNHLATCNRKIADNILRGLSKLLLLGTEHPDGCREGFAIASGFSYGMIMLGRGGEESGPHEADTLRIFGYLLNGNGSNHLPGTKKPVEGGLDLAITSPAAAIALSLSYMRTDRRDIAEMLEIPKSRDRLDHVRPDQILLRTTCRALVMWSDIRCTSEWIEELVPTFIKDSQNRRRKLGAAIPYDQELAYWCIAAGACLAIGLKYAGTAAGEAHATLIGVLDRLNRAFTMASSAATLRIKLTRYTLQACSNTVCLALAAVMAGTGELNVLRRLRVAHGQISESIAYGTHLAYHLSLGLLFLGKGRFTLGNSPLATAALLAAFYPVFPASPADNRFHLQALRHLWVLAVEPRCLVAKDVDTGRTLYLPLKIRVRESPSSLAGRRDEKLDDAKDKTEASVAVKSQSLIAPTLIPHAKAIESIRTDSPRYWPITLDLASSKQHLEKLIHSQTIYVKRRSGHLSYAQDPRGVRGLSSSGRTDGGNAVFDDGSTYELLASDGNSGGDSNDGCDSDAALTMDNIIALAASSPFLHTLQKHLSAPAPSADHPAPGQTAHQVALRQECKISSFVSSVLVECVLQDKLDAILPYISLFHHLQRIEDQVTLTSSTRRKSQEALSSLREISFVSDFYETAPKELYLQQASKKQQPLINASFVSTISRTLASVRVALSQDEGCLRNLSVYSNGPEGAASSAFETSTPPTITRNARNPLPLILLALKVPATVDIVHLRSLVRQQHPNASRQGLPSDASFLAAIPPNIMRDVLIKTLEVAYQQKREIATLLSDALLKIWLPV